MERASRNGVQNEEDARADNCGQGVNAANTMRRRNGPFSVSLTDPEILDCPICLEYLTIPVYQCDNGHIICNSCCIKLLNKCPTCRLPINHNRNRAVEKILESIEVTCENAKYGCKETVSYKKKYDHEEACHYMPCYCSIEGCGFVGSSSHLSQHFRAVHKNLAVQFQYDKALRITLNVHHKLLVLQEEEDGDLFVLNDSTQSHGHGISVFHIAPSWKGGISYFILTRSGGIAYKFQSFTKNIQRWDDNPPSVPLLFVPSDFFGPHEQLDLAIRIQRPKKFEMALNKSHPRVTTVFKTSEDERYQGQLTNMSYQSGFDLLRTKLTDDQKTLLRSTCFGHLLDLPDFTFSGQLIHNVLLREVEAMDVGQELWFVVSGVPIRFSCIEFGLIMGLKFGHNKRMKKDRKKRLLNDYFGGKDQITPKQLDQWVSETDFEHLPDDDAVKLALFYMTERFLVHTDGQRYVKTAVLEFVEHLDSFNKYPWGNEVWLSTYNSLQRALTGRARKFWERKAQNPNWAKEKYNVYGFPMAFQVWCYEAIPYIGSKYGRVVNYEGIPRILKWCTRDVPTHLAMSSAFLNSNEPPLRTLVPIDDEKQSRLYRKLIEYWSTVSAYDDADLEIYTLEVDAEEDVETEEENEDVEEERFDSEDSYIARQ